MSNHKALIPICYAEPSKNTKINTTQRWLQTWIKKIPTQLAMRKQTNERESNKTKTKEASFTWFDDVPTSTGSQTNKGLPLINQMNTPKSHIREFSKKIISQKPHNTQNINSLQTLNGTKSKTLSKPTLSKIT